MNWQDRYQPRREPDRTLRRMTEGDVPQVVTLIGSIGWNHAEADTRRLLYWSPDGCFVIEEAERGVIGTVTTTPYGTALGWIGTLVVAPDRRQNGLGRQLMRAALDHLIARGTRCIMLDATEMARSLYRSLGFRELHQIERWEGKASTYLGPRARRLRPEDVPAVLELDSALFGVPRPFILVRLLEEFPDLAWVEGQRGQVEGYLLGRRLPDAVCLGPWMSRSAQAAERLLRLALEQVQGQTVVLNISELNGRALVLAESHNLRRVRRCTRMIYGDAMPPRGELLADLAVMSLATG